jgi:hypothetical protein
MTISIDAFKSSPDPKENLVNNLTDQSLPVSTRMRALFGLKHINDVQNIALVTTSLSS